MKFTLKTEILPLVIVAASIVLGFYFYNHFPAMVASHWGLSGQPNHFISKDAAAITFPAIILGIYILFWILPKLDPKSERYESFANAYLVIRDVILALMLSVYFLIGLYNLGYPINMKVMVPILVGLMFVILGNYMGKIKRNWFVGIRTPWTLSSENVWNKTHRLGGRLFILLGLVYIVCAFLPKTLGLIALVSGLVIAILGSVVYSYIIFQKEKQGQI